MARRISKREQFVTNGFKISTSSEEVAYDLPRQTSLVDKEDPKKCWYKHSLLGESYFSLSEDMLHEYYFIGDGTKIPNPKEICDQLNSAFLPSYDASRKVFSRYKNQAVTDPIELPSGAYTYDVTRGQGNERLYSLDLRTDKYIEVGGSLGQLHSSIAKFIGSEEKYRKHGILYKLGILLYGSPGQGKSMVIRRVLNEAVVNNSIIFFCDKVPSFFFLETIKRALPDRLKIFVFEELTEVLRSDQMDKVLNFLDGETSIDNSIVFATTNYPEKIPGNIVNRPSRFDKLIHVGSPGQEERKIILTSFLGQPPTKEELIATEGLSIAAIKELALCVVIEDIEFLTALTQLKERNSTCEKNFSKKKDLFGFDYAEKNQY